MTLCAVTVTTQCVNLLKFDINQYHRYDDLIDIGLNKTCVLTR